MDFSGFFKTYFGSAMLIILPLYIIYAKLSTRVICHLTLDRKVYLLSYLFTKQ